MTDYRVYTSSGWTDGSFEFRVYCFLGSPGDRGTPNTTPAGTSVTKRFGLLPSDLFELKYEGYNRGSWPNKKGYVRTSIIGSKSINLLDSKYRNLVELETWDLNRFSYEWKFSFEETDNPAEITTTESLNQKYSMNFGWDATTGELIKV